MSKSNHLRELIRDITCSICRHLGGETEQQLPTGFPVYEMSWNDMVSMLKRHGLELMLKEQYVPDKYIRYADEDNTAILAPYLVYPADLYVEQVADCDDYSMWAVSDASRRFKLNGFRQVWGYVGLSYHAWVLAVTGEDSFKLFENNAGFPYAGELFDPGDYDYIPQVWK